MFVPVCRCLSRCLMHLHWGLKLPVAFGLVSHQLDHVNLWAAGEGAIVALGSPCTASILHVLLRAVTCPSGFFVGSNLDPGTKSSCLRLRR